METTQASTDTVQPQAETNAQPAVIDRLEKEYGVGTTQTTPSTETTPEVKTETTPKNEETKTENKEGETKTETTPENTTNDENTWKLDDTTPNSNQSQEEGSWKTVIEDLGFSMPEDYNEENGYELFKSGVQNFAKAESEKAVEMFKADRFADVPDNLRAEANLIVELMKQGQTLQQINEPFQMINSLKSMSDEQLVRDYYERQDGFDADMVDHKMQQLSEGNGLSIEAKILRNNIENYEKTLNSQRQQQINQYKDNLQKIQAQKTERANLELKLALDRVPEFLGKKLPSEVKEVLNKELTSGEYEKMPGTPEEKVGYLLWRKFGTQAMKSFQDRVQEDLTKKSAQTKHNVPPVTTGSANRPDNNSQNLSRVEREYGSF